MTLAPKQRPKKTWRERSFNWLVGLAAFVLFGPFAIVYLAAFLGSPMPDGWFGIWFMGALTIAGVVTTLDFAKGLKTHGLGELGCVLPLAFATFWFGYVFLKELRIIE